MVCTTNRIQSRISVHGNPRNEPFKVLFISKKARRKPLQENKFVVVVVRVVLEYYLHSPPLNMKFSISDRIQFNEANKVLHSYLKHLASTSKIAGTIHKNSLMAESVQKLFESGELATTETKIP